jgi:hypothetical protein
MPLIVACSTIDEYEGPLKGCARYCSETGAKPRTVSPGGPFFLVSNGEDVWGRKCGGSVQPWLWLNATAVAMYLDPQIETIHSHTGSYSIPVMVFLPVRR